MVIWPRNSLACAIGLRDIRCGVSGADLERAYLRRFTNALNDHYVLNLPVVRLARTAGAFSLTVRLTLFRVIARYVAQIAAANPIKIGPFPGYIADQNRGVGEDGRLQSSRGREQAEDVVGGGKGRIR